MKTGIHKYLNIFFIVALLLGLTGCYDDFDMTNPGAIPEGRTTVRAVIDFNPFAESMLDTRSDAPAGDFAKEIYDMAVLVYDKNEKLVEDHYFMAEDLNLKYVDRKPENSPLGSIAEQVTRRASFDLDIPFGVYHIYAVANLGHNYGKSDQQTTEDILRNENNVEKIQTVDGLRSIRADFNPDDAGDNNEMFGYFTVTPEKYAPDNSYSEKCEIVRNNTEIHCWLRRLVSKVTIDFDTSDLNDNVKVYIRRATVRDVPVSCPIGMMNTPVDTTQLLRLQDNPVGWNATRHCIDFASIAGGGGASTDDYKTWPVFDNGTKKVWPENAHTETAKSLIFYENMQDKGVDKRQFAAADGTVLNKERWKDEKPYGSYIEVEGYYQNFRSGQLTQGPIIYRFMLGENVIDDYNAMRNRHYKLTLKIRGNGNDTDWHILYESDGTPVARVPYYISYVYNHDMKFNYKVTPENPTDKITKLTGEITQNDWFPEGAAENVFYKGNGCTDNNYTNRANGFLSLKPTMTTILTNENNTNNINHYYGTGGEGIDKSKREYPVDKSTSYNFTSNGQHRTDTVGVKIDPVTNAIEWSIPMYTRAKTLIASTGYTSNNPFRSHFRITKVKMTAEINNDAGRPIKNELKIPQLESMGNSNGVYRKWNNREPFHVILKKLKEESSSQFINYESDGPWRAYIESGDTDFIDIGGAGNKTAKGPSGEIEFDIRFKGSGGANKVKNAVIRIDYNNYSCVHLIFVRQGYEAQELIPGGAEWYTTNMLGPGVRAEHPCDEGSMFKYGNWDQPFDESGVIVHKRSWAQMTPADFTGRTDALPLYPSGSAVFSDVEPVASGFSDEGGLVARTGDYRDLKEYKYIEQGYGVLYGDGATEPAVTVEKAYGWQRHLPDNSGYGMQGMFVYYFNQENRNDSYNGRNIFFPLGSASYGVRKAQRFNENADGVLRYAAGRIEPMPSDASTAARPLLWDLYRKPGALYFANKFVPRSGPNDNHGDAGLDMNYFTYDMDIIDCPNVYHAGTTFSSACFLRTVKRSAH